MMLPRLVGLWAGLGLLLALTASQPACRQPTPPDEVAALPTGLPQYKPGWALQSWLPPNELAVPTDVIVNSNDEIIAAESWDTLSLIEQHDERWSGRNLIDDPQTASIERLRIYSLARESDQLLWGYNFARGEIYRLERRGLYFEYRAMAFPELFTPLESTIAFLPGHGLLIAQNLPGPAGAHTRLSLLDTTTLRLRELAKLKLGTRALAPMPGRPGVLALLDDDGLYELAPPQWNSAPLDLRLERPGSYNGMVADQAGRLYLSSGDWLDRSAVFRVIFENDRPHAEQIFSSELGGLQGIDIAPDAEALVGVNRRTGALLRIPLSGADPRAEQALISGNGAALPQMLAVAREPSPERIALLISDGETGRILRLDGPGATPRLVADVVNYNFVGSRMSCPPERAELLFPINAPGFERMHGVRVISLDGASTQRRLLEAAAWTGLRPGSAISAPDNGVLITDLQPAGRIITVDRAGQAAVLVDPAAAPLLRFPLGLQLLPNGGLLVGVNAHAAPSYAGVPASDTILLLLRDQSGGWETRTAFSGMSAGDGVQQHPAINDFTADAQGTLYIAFDDQIVSSDPPYRAGHEKIVATGFGQALGLALDAQGGLFVSDGRNSAIWRLTPASQATDGR